MGGKGREGREGEGEGRGGEGTNLPSPNPGSAAVSQSSALSSPNDIPIRYFAKPERVKSNLGRKSRPNLRLFVHIRL